MFVLYFSSLNVIPHKHCYSHRTYTTGNRSNRRSNTAYIVIVHVSAQLAVFVTVHAYVNYYSALLNHVCSYKLSLTNCCHQYVCTAANLFKIFCAAVTDCNSAVFVEKKHRLRFTHDVTASHNNALLTAYFNTCQADKLHYTCGCAGEKVKISYHDFTHVYRVECIDILFRKNTQKHLFTVNALGKRKLYENTVNIGSAVQLINKLEQFLLGSLCGECIFLGIDSALCTRLFLIVYIYAACAIIAYDDYCKSCVNALLF